MSSTSLVSNQNFRLLKESARLDKRGRLTLGTEVSSRQYRVMINEAGQILLDPVINIPEGDIPERELWLWKNREAISSLKKGMQQAASGDLHDLGSFANYADEEIDD